jgi:antitoxin component YwqK of YwqJK toxin-antitoxin module
MNNDNMQDILKNYYANGGKTLFEAEQLDEIDFRKAAATAMAVGALAGAPQYAQAGTDTAQGIDSNKPVATQQVQQVQLKPHQQLDKDHYFNRKANRAFNTKFKFTGENPFAPGIKIEELMPYVKIIHSQAPAHFGKNISKFKIVPSNHNKSEMMGVIEYEHGKLEIHMVAGGKLKSALVWSVNNTPIGSVKKYIPLFYNWHSKNSGNVPTEYSLD